MFVQLTRQDMGRRLTFYFCSIKDRCYSLHFLCLALALIQQLSTSAQSQLRQDITLGVNGLYSGVKAPVLNAKRTLFIGSATLAIGAGLYAVDRELQENIRGNPTTVQDITASWVGEPLGNPLFHVGLLGIQYGLSTLYHNDEWRTKTVRWASATAFSSIVVLSSKALFARARPYTQQGPDAWFQQYLAGEEFRSFPSGHTILAFTLASSTTYLYPNQKWIPYLVYPLASITAWSRVYQDKHWPSDVFIGAVLGHFIGRAVARGTEIQFGVVPNAFNGTSLSATLDF